MEKKINKFIIVELMLMLGSIIANVLYCMDKISRDSMQIGFILVLLGSIAVNYFNGKAKSKGENIRFKRGPLEIFLTIIIGITWVISYGFTY